MNLAPLSRLNASKSTAARLVCNLAAVSISRLNSVSFKAAGARVGASSIFSLLIGSASLQADAKEVRPVLKVGQVIQDCADCPPLVTVPPVGKTTISTTDIPLYISKYELTWHEYLASVKRANCPMPERDIDLPYDRNDARLDDNRPVTGVPSAGFRCYLTWIRKQTNRHYRLPTEAEWKHAARAGSKTKYPWGDDLGYDRALIHNHYDLSKIRLYLNPNDPRLDVKYGGTFPVGLFKPNAWGLYDVVGNAAETIDNVTPISRCPKSVDRQRCFSIMTLGGQSADYNKNNLIDSPLYFFEFGSSMRGYRLVRE